MENFKFDPAAERADQLSGERALPLLRLRDWDRDKQYNKNNPKCIHYDFRWKVARPIFLGTDPDLILAPSDFLGDSYMCEEMIIDISIERSPLIDTYLKGLKGLFKKGRKITFSIRFIYKEVIRDFITTKGHNEEEVDVNIKILPYILKDVLNDGPDMAKNPKDVQVDKKGKLKEYYQCLKLNSILQHLKLILNIMVKGGVKPGFTLQFVSNVKRFL
ncbi:hypothetical protein QBC46DRAFT_366439 [Diplogelasinospora grovesii]|uniref:Uncharacterized protein n=1 Tax=Diplogelasinospora grovesii TaxID=303347 RepID=A0AAN6N3D4_9PEZI|nr:hypothetical protein QBC46DRAFT_366439 [Diplogelasinospora grovesii]